MNMAEYGSCCKQREVFVDKSHRAVAGRASLEEVDRPSPYPAEVISATEDDDNVRDIGKHDFPSVLLHPMLSNGNPCSEVFAFLISQSLSYFNLLLWR